MRFQAFIAALMALLLAGSPAFAGKGDVCRTPDGFVFGASSGNGMGGTGIKSSERKGMGGTGINGNGMGGTGSKFTERNGIGGTGIGRDGDIGVYGRITGFGSICVNGMEIEYKKTTPVKDEGREATVRDLQVGQIVAARVYKDDKGEFRARHIAIDKIISGRVKNIDQKRGQMTVVKDLVILGPKVRGQIKTLREGDFVAVSGLRRKDGAIMASHIERASPSRSAGHQLPTSLYGAGVSYFSIQGYVKSSGGEGTLQLTNGLRIAVPRGMSRPRDNDRVIINGIVGHSGMLTAETIVPEVKTFLPAIDLPIIKGENGLLGPGGIQLPLLSPNGGGGSELALPSLPGGGIAVPSVDVPAVDVPPVEVPGLPPVDLPPIDVPALPPIEIPVPPVDIPVIPVPPVIPDLPILPGH